MKIVPNNCSKHLYLKYTGTGYTQSKNNNFHLIKQGDNEYKAYWNNDRSHGTLTYKFYGEIDIWLREKTWTKISKEEYENYTS